MSQVASRLHAAPLAREMPVQRTGSAWLFWPIAIAAAILYGSLLPFDFDASALRAINLTTVFGLRLRTTTPEDVITNLLVYVPLGFSIVRAGGPQFFARLACVPLAVLFGVILSLLAETLQTAVAIRVASLTDVVLNASGTLLGALLGTALLGLTRIARRRFRRCLTERPRITLARMLTVGILLFGLAPFDFVTNSAALHDSFRAARGDLTTVRTVAVGEPPFQALVSQVSSAAWFALLGYLFTLSRGTPRRHPFRAWAASVRHGVFLAGLIEALQLFTVSHGFDLATLALRVVATAFGAWTAVFVLLVCPDRRHDPGRRLPGVTSLLALLAAGQIAMVLLASFDPAGLSWSGLNLSSVEWIPFEAAWRRPLANAAADTLGTLAVYGTLAFTAAIVLRRIRVHGVWSMTTAVVMFSALVAEFLQACSVSRTADSTGPIVGLVSILLAYRVLSVLDTPQGEPTGSTGSWSGTAETALPTPLPQVSTTKPIPTH